jgi:hypothetical protein
LRPGRCPGQAGQQAQHARAEQRRPVHPGARAIVTELMREWQESLAAGIRAMQRNGNLPLSLDVDQAAAALLAGIQGGVSIMLSTGQSAHLRAALDWGIARLRAAGGIAS